MEVLQEGKGEPLGWHDPDVAFIHVHRCDIYGNAQIDGILVEDFELSRCARRLIITTEEIPIDQEYQK